MKMKVILTTTNQKLDKEYKGCIKYNINHISRTEIHDQAVQDKNSGNDILTLGYNKNR